MTITIKTWTISLLLTAIIAVACTKYWWPSITHQIKEVQTEVIKNDIKTTTKIVERNGTKETIIEQIDNSTQAKKFVKQETTYKRSEWIAGLGASTRFEKLEPEFSILLARRIIGPIFAGIQASTATNIGVVMMMEF